MFEPNSGLWIETLEEITTNVSRLPPGDIYKTPFQRFFSGAQVVTTISSVWFELQHDWINAVKTHDLARFRTMD